MNDTDAAALFAIALARKRGQQQIGADELLLGCLHTRSRYGIVELGDWNIDLEALGIDWLEHPASEAAKPAYSQTAVEIFDRAARIARADSSKSILVEHLLAAFAPEESGLMGELKKLYSITSAGWRAALVGGRDRGGGEAAMAAVAGVSGGGAAVREYLSPEEAAETLGVHVQTLRAYVRSGKLPALRLAGERAIRIRRSDLDKVLEPVQPEKST